MNMIAWNAKPLLRCRPTIVSFPLGHTTMAFAFSSVLTSLISNPYATIGLYCLVVLTASQRMYSDQHWLSDVILGASIGTAVGQRRYKIVTFSTKSQPNGHTSFKHSKHQNYQCRPIRIRVIRACNGNPRRIITKARLDFRSLIRCPLGNILRCFCAIICMY